MFHHAVSSTPIPVFTTANHADKKGTPEVPIVPEVSFEEKEIQKELIKIDFDKQTVSARALYAFFELGERFSKWWRRMVFYGLGPSND